MSEIKKGYVAGSLFNKAEVNERLREGRLLKENLPDSQWYNPIEAPINDKATLPTAEDIFIGDYRAILDADCIIADITNNDVGVAMELGIAVALKDARSIIEKALKDEGVPQESMDRILEVLDKEGVRDREVYAHNSDIRVATSGEYSSHYVPYGQNQFVIGGIEYMGNRIHSSIEEIIEKIKR